MVGRLLLDRNE